MNSPTDRKLVIFDCDGVLVDSETLGNRVLVQFVAEFGLTLELEEAIVLFKGCKMADCVAVIEQKLGKKIPPDFVTQLRTRTAEVFERELLPVEGIEAALEQINLPICVASSGPVEKIKLALRVTNLLSRFEGRIFRANASCQQEPLNVNKLHNNRISVGLLTKF